MPAGWSKDGEQFRDDNHIIKDGFKTWEQAREFVEAFYLEQGIILPREAKH
jgi:hypothetical protein